MILQELKKIWTPMRIVLLVVVSFLMYYSFLNPIVKRFEAGNGIDSFQEKMRISKEWIMEYGSTIEAEEFIDIEDKYIKIITKIEESMLQKKIFVECAVKNYQDFFEYQTNALNGKEGFHYKKYREMEAELFTGTPYNSVYLQEYKAMMESYKKASLDCHNILPEEVIIYSSDFLRYLFLWYLVLVLLLAAPVMVNDAASNINIEQYTTKIGRRIYKKQYFCTIVSILFAEAVVIIFGMNIWKTTNAFDFAKVGIASFLYSVKPTLQIAYGEIFSMFMIIMGFVGVGAGSIAFCLSSCSNRMISMLTKIIPLAVITGIYILSLESIFYENNVLYSFTHISGVEIIVAIIIFVIGIIFAVMRYQWIKGKY